MPRHATSTSFKPGHTPWCKGEKGSRPDLALRNRVHPTRGRKGKVSSPEFKEKVRLGVLEAYKDGRLIPMAGELNPQYGKPTTEKQKESARELFKRLNQDPEFCANRRNRLKVWNKEHKAEKGEIFRERNKDPEFIKKRLKALCRRPTKPEQWLIDLIFEYKLPYKYVGDGSVIIGGLNPDFINVNSKKKIIEIFGRIWHDTLLEEDDWKRSELGRIMAFKPYGFDTLILWDDELGDKDAIVNKIKRFERRK